MQGSAGLLTILGNSFSIAGPNGEISRVQPKLTKPGPAEPSHYVFQEAILQLIMSVQARRSITHGNYHKPNDNSKIIKTVYKFVRLSRKQETRNSNMAIPDMANKYHVK